METAVTEAPGIAQPYQGGIYAGLTIHNETPMRLVLLPDEFNGKWKPAMSWAKKLDAELPTRMDFLAMWNNARGEFDKYWYWSGEEFESGAGYAWCQLFNDGSQITSRKILELRARAVRRYAI